MSKMNSPYKHMYDAAPEAALMVRGDAAKTASFSGTALLLDVLAGYWNPAPAAPADQTLAVIINVLAVAGASVRKATMTFATVVDTNAFTLSDGVQTKTFTAGTDFVTGGTDTITATNAVNAINTAHGANQIGITATNVAGVITLTNTRGTGGTITEAVSTISTTPFAGNDESYLLELEAGPVGFATSAIFGSIAVKTPGQYVILLDIDTVKAVKADAAAIRIKGTLAGAAPSITAYSWIAGVC